MTTVQQDPTLAWFERLEAEGNTKAFWQTGREAYARDVREPFAAFLAAVDGQPGVPAHGAWRVYRPHNDLRFDPQGDPLKTFVGAVAETARGAGLYVQVDRTGLLVAAGMPWFAPDQLGRWREAVASGAGEALVDAAERARAGRLRVHGGRRDPYVRVPRGYAADHPRAGLLRWRGVEASVRLGSAAWGADGASTEERAAVAAEPLRAAGALVAWCEEEVGTSTLPRPRR
ncbi:DUF2461 family protein [Aquipuribacter nitratireducens]|uniref:DUF2461 family protein n=1 Tax=Aquipuribacter nitratireducens TaxID=650104 RepID=A0ABW0GNJ0_9MICO